MSDLSIENACNMNLDFWKWLTLLGSHNQHSNFAQSLIHLSGGFSLFASPDLEKRETPLLLTFLFFLPVFFSGFGAIYFILTDNYCHSFEALLSLYFSALRQASPRLAQAGLLL